MARGTSKAALAVELVEQFERFGPAYVRWVASNLPRDGISPQRLRVLEVLRGGGPCSMHQLGRNLDVTGRAVTQLVDGLEREGLVRRVRSEADRRVVLVEATPAGEDIAATDHRRHRQAVGRLFESLGTTKMESLLAALSDLNEELGVSKT